MRIMEKTQTEMENNQPKLITLEEKIEILKKEQEEFGRKTKGSFSELIEQQLAWCYDCLAFQKGTISERQMKEKWDIDVPNLEAD